jgi:hypothetical protein
MTLGLHDPILNSVNFNDTVSLTPGLHEIKFFIAENDTTIGKAERCGPGPWDVFYGMKDKGIGFSSTYTDTPVNITVTDFAVLAEGDTVSADSTKLLIYLDKYMDVHVKVLGYNDIMPTRVPLIRADESGLMFNLFGQPVEGGSGIIIRNGKKYLIR